MWVFRRYKENNALPEMRSVDRIEGQNFMISFFFFDCRWVFREPMSWRWLHGGQDMDDGITEDETVLLVF